MMPFRRLHLAARHQLMHFAIYLYLNQEMMFLLNTLTNIPETWKKKSVEFVKTKKNAIVKRKKGVDARMRIGVYGNSARWNSWKNYGVIVKRWKPNLSNKFAIEKD